MVIKRHKSAGHTESPDGGTGKMCLGGGMYCPSASIVQIELTLKRARPT